MTHKFSTEMAIKVIVGDVRVLQDGGAGLEEQLSFVKQHLFDESFMDKKDRNNALKEINQLLGTNWSMTQIRKSPTKSFTNTTTNNLVEVDELNGSIVIQTAPESEVAQEVVAEQTKTNSDEEIAMNTVNTAAATAATPNTAAETTTAQEVTMETVKPMSVERGTKEVTMFFQFLGTSLEDGLAMFEEYREGNEAAKKSYAEVEARHPNLEATQKFATWADYKQDEVQDFSIFVAAKTKGGAHCQTVAGKSEAIESKYIGAAAALIGGAIDMFTDGAISLPKVAGALVGAGAAYMLGDMIDSNIENQYGRYTAAGAVGLLLGGAGSFVAGAVSNNIRGKAEPAAAVEAPATFNTTNGDGTVAGL